jgi:ATP-dependent DNA ligase
VPAYPARETRKAYSVSRVWANAGGLDVTRALLGRQRAEATALPNWIKPQLTKLVDQAPDGPEWLHEIKFDGYRMHAWLDRGAARLLELREDQSLQHRLLAIGER